MEVVAGAILPSCHPTTPFDVDGRLICENCCGCPKWMFYASWILKITVSNESQSPPGQAGRVQNFHTLTPALEKEVHLLLRNAYLREETHHSYDSKQQIWHDFLLLEYCYQWQVRSGTREGSPSISEKCLFAWKNAPFLWLQTANLAWFLVARILLSMAGQIYEPN